MSKRKMTIALVPVVYLRIETKFVYTVYIMNLTLSGWK